MIDYKITGACTRCDAMCFRVLDTQKDGSPKRLGPPIDGAVRVSFMLMDGTRTSLTFCADCATMLPGELYVSIWQRIKAFYDTDQQDRTDEIDARLQRYAKYRMWTEGKDGPGRTRPTRQSRT
jgi:hypothetical protein